MSAVTSVSESLCLHICMPSYSSVGWLSVCGCLQAAREEEEEEEAGDDDEIDGAEVDPGWGDGEEEEVSRGGREDVSCSRPDMSHNRIAERCKPDFHSRSTNPLLSKPQSFSD